MNCENIPEKGKKSSFRFRREEHLKGRNEIREVFGKGKRFGCRGARLFVLKNDLPHNRICFTFSRGFGTAVVRNRSRRISREVYRHLLPRLYAKAEVSAVAEVSAATEVARGYDLILQVNSETERLFTARALSDRAEQLEFLFTKAGLLT